MIYWRLFLGLILLLFSSIISDLISAHTTAQILIDGKDYLPVFINKTLDALGGSLLVWGVLKNPKK